MPTLLRLLLLGVLASACVERPGPPPEVAEATLALGNRHSPYSAQVVATGGEGTLEFDVAGLGMPPGLTLSGSGLLSGTPTAAGTFSFTAVATDEAEQSGRGTITVEILASAPPRIVTQQTPHAAVGRAYSADLAAEGGTQPFSWTATSLPAGLALSSSGAVSGTANAAGTFPLQVSLVDARGQTAQATVSLQVNPALTITTQTLADAYTDTATLQTLVAQGGAAPYGYTLDAGSLPAGISLSSSGLLGGTAASTGDFSFTVRVTDSAAQTATRPLVLKIRAPVAITTASLPDAYQGAGYSHSLAATGGEGTLQWSISSGALPSGIQLASSGALSGTVGGTATTSTVTLRATDANGRFADRSLTLNVYALPVITTSSLAGGTTGVAYSRTVATSGGKAPLSFSVSAGALPGGLTLTASSGAVSGTPNAVGSFGFTVLVTDSNASTASQAFTVEVVSGTGTSAPFAAASWNIEWFGSTGLGPTDEALQLQNASRVISESDIDAWGLVEIVSTSQFQALLGNLTGYAGFLANDVSVTNGSSYYSAAEQKLGFIYDTSKVQVNGASLILTANDSDFAGRPPLRVDTTVTVDGHSVDITFIMLHLKAFADATSRAKREVAAGHLKTYLDTNLSTQEVIVMGDWNDDVDESIVWDSATSSYMATPFANFVGDATDYRYLTGVLSSSGGTSTVGYNDMIDHHLATNELVALHVPSSLVIRPDLWATPITNYGATTSDHFPVLSRFDLTGSGGGGGNAELILNEVLFDEPGTNFAAEFVEIRNVGTTQANLAGWSLADVYGSGGALGGATRHVFTGTLAPGATVVVYGGAAGMSGAPTNSVAASSGQLSLHPLDEIRLVSPSGVIEDSLYFSTTFGDGISANRSTDGDGGAGWVAHTSLNAQLSSPGTRVDGSAW
ncbi:MAG: putative Ig domain-containing protein [Myxococcota bacterium]|nr:putative Ig domain-containing protein [Myxococcota bacterium]